MLGSLKTIDIFDCYGRKLGKLPALSFNKSVTRSISPFDIVHPDVGGSSPITSKLGSNYYVHSLMITLIIHGFIL